VPTAVPTVPAAPPSAPASITTPSANDSPSSLTTSPTETKLAQTDSRVDYRVGVVGAGAQPNEMSGQVCGNCRFFDGDNSCAVVAGDIDPRWTSNLWTSPSGAEQMLSENSERGDALFVETGVFSDAADSATPPSWIPFIPKPGVYKHPLYGDVEISAERTARLAASVANKVYQEHIPLDLEHQTKLSGAAGYIRELRLNSDGSADARIDWTPRGIHAISSKQFRYVSPEWFRKWEQPLTGQIHEDVVAGGALTTRPFFKEGSLRALVASESGTTVIGAPEPPADGAAVVVDPSFSGTARGAAAMFANLESVARQRRTGLSTTDPDGFRDFSPDKRKELAKEGKALPDGSFPIETVADLENAIRAVGRRRGTSLRGPERWAPPISSRKAGAKEDSWTRTDRIRPQRLGRTRRLPPTLRRLFRRPQSHRLRRLFRLPPPRRPLWRRSRLRNSTRFDSRSPTS
jgi:hypothetical protein